MKLSAEDKAKLSNIIAMMAEANETEFAPPITAWISDEVITLSCATEKESFPLIRLDAVENYFDQLQKEAKRIGFARKCVRTEVNNLLQTLDGDCIEFGHLHEYEDMLDDISTTLSAYIRPIKAGKKNEEDDF